jgi:cellulose synthase/poly-beta-1,6-N-acetylglucosamine synthase-like glycosyltransferase
MFAEEKGSPVSAPYRHTVAQPTPETVARPISLTAPASHRIVIISPCRDEERTLERTIACLEAQTLRPARWIVVDDGSTDRTRAILESAARRLPFMRVVCREDRG